ncbi:DNA-binding transcriptional LysR family regulator [Oxalobacteraceae bacterium GrIS 2.11]
MDMLREMAVFAQVVDSGTFSAAARQLGLTTSAVSRHVSRLESHLGTSLLQRTTRSFALTELGQEVYAGCVRMLGNAREIHALAGSYSARPTGTIRISAPVVLGQVWLAPHLPKFQDLNPDVHVQVTLVDRTVDLIEEGLDLAIRISRELAPGLAARKLQTMRYMLVASPDYIDKHGAPDTPTALLAHRCIYLGYSVIDGRWTLKCAAEQVSIHVDSRLTINNSAAIVAAVEAGGGIGLVPDFAVASALAAQRVIQVLPQWEFCEPHARSIHAVYIPRRHLPLKIRAFIDFLAGLHDTQPGL